MTDPTQTPTSVKDTPTKPAPSRPDRLAEQAQPNRPVTREEFDQLRTRVRTLESKLGMP